MSPFLVKAIQLLLSLSLLVVLHELGHFIPAKLFKTRVEKFFLFFDVKFALFKKKIGETEYGIGWLPLGGYVKISGMIDESMDTEQMKQEPQSWEFRSKPTWQRLIIMLGGVTVNLILGFLIYMMILFVWGKNTLSNEDLPNGLQPSSMIQELGFESGDQLLAVDGKPLENVLDVNRHLFLRSVESIDVKHSNGARETIAIPKDIGLRMFEAGDMFPLMPLFSNTIDSIAPNQAAAAAGLQVGDEIKGIDGEMILGRAELIEAIRSHKETEMALIYSRNQRLDTLQITPNTEGMIGIVFKQPSIASTNVQLNIGESIVQGFDFGYWILYDYVAQFKYIFTKKGAQEVGGFGAIGNLFPSTWDWKGFWSSTALISIILAFMNILPIPALDGGHVMFLLYEMISGRKPNDKFMEYAQMFGFFLLMALVLYANGNDIYRAIFN